MELLRILGGERVEGEFAEHGEGVESLGGREHLRIDGG